MQIIILTLQLAVMISLIFSLGKLVLSGIDKKIEKDFEGKYRK